MVLKLKEPLLKKKYLLVAFYHHIFASSKIRTTLTKDTGKDWWQHKKEKL